MTLQGIVALAMAYIDLASDMPTDIKEMDSREKIIYKNIVDAINVAYMTIARDKWRPVYKQTVDVLSGGIININVLDKQYISLKNITSVQGTRIAYRETKDIIYIAEDYKTAVVEYYYLPEELDNSTDTPIIPDAVVHPSVYASYAASMYYSMQKRHTEAAAWDARYRNAVDAITENRGARYIKPRRWR